MTLWWNLELHQPVYGQNLIILLLTPISLQSLRKREPLRHSHLPCSVASDDFEKMHSPKMDPRLRQLRCCLV